jgi:galactose-1-phosphate uridylyltransferase
MAPFGARNFHMHISLTPRLANWAGFEHQSGVIMNSVLPETAAREYKANLAK